MTAVILDCSFQKSLSSQTVVTRSVITPNPHPTPLLMKVNSSLMLSGIAFFQVKVDNIATLFINQLKVNLYWVLFSCQRELLLLILYKSAHYVGHLGTEQT